MTNTPDRLAINTQGGRFNGLLFLSVASSEMVSSYLSVKALNLMEGNEPLWDSINNVVAKCVRPFVKEDQQAEMAYRLEQMQKLSQNNPSKEQAKPAPATAKEAKVQKIACELSKYGVLFLVGEPVLFGSQVLSDKLLGVQVPHGAAYGVARLADWGTNFAMMGAFNFIGPIRKGVDVVENAMTKVLTNLGMEKMEAENLAKATVNVRVPGLAGMAVNYAMLNRSISGAGHTR